MVEITSWYQQFKLVHSGSEANDLTQNLVVARFLFIFLPIGNSFLSCNCSDTNSQYVPYVKDWSVLAILRTLDH